MTMMLHRVINKSLADGPDESAVVLGEASMTYAELDSRSNQVARVMRDLGLGSGDRVAIHLEKSLEAVIAILAVSKMGAAYVPVDPAAPTERVGFILRDCQVGGLITTNGAVGHLSHTIRDGEWPEWVLTADAEDPTNSANVTAPAITPWPRDGEASSDSLPDPNVRPEDLAYILYTSGSTGSPKGVMVDHRAAMYFVSWAAHYFGLGPGDRVANHAPLHFDLSTFDIFATLRSGGTVMQVPAMIAMFPRNLADFLEQNRVSVSYSVPSVLVRLVLHGGLERHRFERLRHILFAGEVFPPKYLRRLCELIPQARYHNLYGPTETNVCTFYSLVDHATLASEPLPIGRALPGTDVAVVAADGRPVPSGEIGELHVSGPCVMMGYWSATAEAEREDSFSDLGEGPGRTYPTGDLVWEDERGDLRFVGRRDSMVKSGGYRIELGEIEATLLRHDDVLAVVALPVPDDTIGNVIRAAASLKDGSDLDEDQLLKFGARYLPKYMLPETVEFLEALPLTSTGKVDRQLLLQREIQRQEG